VLKWDLTVGEEDGFGHGVQIVDIADCGIGIRVDKCTVVGSLVWEIGLGMRTIVHGFVTVPPRLVCKGIA